MDQFLTMYKKDYIPKPLEKKKDSYIIPQQYKDPLSEAYKTYLELNETKEHPPTEAVDDYLKKFEESYADLNGRYMKAPLDKNAIANSKKLKGCSTYQVDYCDIEKDIAYLEEIKKRKKITLPPDWYFPLTTQKIFYRNPTLLKKDALVKEKAIKQVSNLGNKEHILKILKVRTGKSEYEAYIGDLGGMIVEEQLHGKIMYPE